MRETLPESGCSRRYFGQACLALKLSSSLEPQRRIRHRAQSILRPCWQQNQRHRGKEDALRKEGSRVDKSPADRKCSPLNCLSKITGATLIDKVFPLRKLPL